MLWYRRQIRCLYINGLKRASHFKITLMFVLYVCKMCLSFVANLQCDINSLKVLKILMTGWMPVQMIL